jgi:transposase-like protein
MTNTPRRRALARVRTRFLQLLRQGRSGRAAAEAAGVPRSSLYKWRRTLPEFADAWQAVPGRRAPPTRPPKAQAPPVEWIEIPGQGRRHVSTVGRRTDGPRNGP